MGNSLTKTGARLSGEIPGRSAEMRSRRPLARQFMKTKPTYNEGSNDERDAALAYLRGRIKHFKNFQPLYSEVIAELKRAEKWLLGRSNRYNKKPGGLGKKTKGIPNDQGWGARSAQRQGRFQLPGRARSKVAPPSSLR